MAESLIHIVGAGFLGSAVTYTLTWWRERKRMIDAYRAPQREAIAGIIAAANELAIANLHFRGLCVQIVEFMRDESPQRFTQEDMNRLQQQFDRASMGLDYAVQVGRLTIVDASCYEKMGAAYNSFAQIKSAFDMAISAVVFGGEQKPDELEGAAYQLKSHAAQLEKDIIDLVNIADDRVSPVQSLRDQIHRRGVTKRFDAEFFNEAAVKPADASQPQPSE